MRISAVALSLIFVVTCQYSESRYAKRQVRPEEVFGTWVATDFAIQNLKEVGVRDHLHREDHVLILRTDGTCHFRTIWPPSSEHARYIDRDVGCRWHLGKVGHQALEFELAGGPPLIAYFYFTEEDGHLLIWQYAADPDAWKYVEFTKRSA